MAPSPVGLRDRLHRFRALLAFPASADVRIASVRADVRAVAVAVDELLAVTVDEQQTLRDISASLRRLESAVSRQDDRLEKLEDGWQQVRGMVTLAKYTLSLLGLGGLATIIVVLGQAAR